MGDGMPSFDISHNYMTPFLLLPKHLLLNTTTRSSSPTWHSSSYVLNSGYGLNFVDNFNTLVIMSIRGSLGL